MLTSRQRGKGEKRQRDPSQLIGVAADVRRRTRSKLLAENPPPYVGGYARFLPSSRLCVFAPKPFARGGFSLIELMVVVVLIGIMTAMILPAMKGTYEDALLRSTARTLVDALTLANSRAVSINQLHRVRVDRKAGRCVVERKVHDAQKGTAFIAIRDTPGAEGAIDSRISAEIRHFDEPQAPGAEVEPIPRENTDRDAIAFYQDGTAEAAEIVLKDRDNFKLALRVNPTTGRVRLVELGRE